MDVLGKPWNGLIMAALLAQGSQRYSELKARLEAMGDRMLSARLKELEELGLVLRRVAPGPPVRVAYELSEVGREFREVGLALSRWGSRFAPLGGKPARRQRRNARRGAVRTGRPAP
jgi:DNA-binding HxlR family transcriptional regulator